MKCNFLTVKAAAGIAPPPPDIAPGCGRPWGGNIGNGGGAAAANARVPTAAAPAAPPGKSPT